MSQFCQKFVKIVKNLAELLLKISPFEKKLVFFCIFSSISVIFAKKQDNFEKNNPQKIDFYAVFTIFGWDFDNLLKFVNHNGKNRFLRVFSQDFKSF